MNSTIIRVLVCLKQHLLKLAKKLYKNNTYNLFISSCIFLIKLVFLNTS